MRLHSSSFYQIKSVKMKTLNIAFSFFFLLLVSLSFAQTKTEKLAVAGECGMCKKTIESAAKSAGASSAAWSADTKVLTVKYKSTSTNSAKIENAVAAAGYDTRNVKATEAAYNKLHDCCKYDRSSSPNAAKVCCDDANCTTSACMKDGKCTSDMSCCKEAGCDQKDCCKKA